MNTVEPYKSGESQETMPTAIRLKLRLSMLIPSPLIGKSVPVFSFNPVQGRKFGLANVPETFGVFTR